MVLLIFLILIIFIFGICVGSFLNVLIYRLPRNLPVVWGRSFCPKCKKKILWFDNIPLLSFVILGGRCRFCQKKISWRYPAVELLTGIFFILGYLSHLRIVDFILISGFLVIFFTDLEHQIIPDQIIFFLVLLFFFYSLITNYRLLISNLFPTAVVSGTFFYFLHLITRGAGMGLGDVKLASLIGLVLGFPKGGVTFYLAFLTGAIIGVILILLKKVKFGQEIPFGPFLVSGCLVTLFLGEKIIWTVERFF